MTLLSLADAGVLSCSLLVGRCVAMAFPLGVAVSCLKCAVTTVSTVCTNNTEVPARVPLEPSPCVARLDRQCFFLSISDGTCNKSAHVGAFLSYHGVSSEAARLSVVMRQLDMVINASPALADPGSATWAD